MKTQTFRILCGFLYFTGILFIGCKNQIKEINTGNYLGSTSLKQTTINWIGTWQNRESKKRLVNSVIREFEIQHQDLNFFIKYQEEFCGGCKDARVIIQDTIIRMINQNRYPWDIIPLTAKYYADIARILNDDEWGKKYLVNFEEFDWFKNSHIKQVFEVSQYRDDMGGIFTGPLIEGRNYGLWYNTETAKKLGIQIKNFGMTFDDFLGYCKAVQKYNQNTKEKITFMSSNKINEQITDILGSLILSELSEFKSQLPPRNIALAAIKKSLLAIEELSKFNAIEKSVVADKDFIYNLNGTVLFTVQASSWYNQCESEDAQKALLLVPAELPVFKNSARFYRGSFQSVWAVFKNAPHRDQAIELMKYICSNDVAERWLSTTYNPTGLKVKLNSSDFGQNEIEKFNTYIENKYGENLINFDLGKLLFNKKTDKTLWDPAKVFQGEMTASECYKKLVSQL